MSEPRRLLESPKYQAWKRIAASNGCTVRSARILLDLPGHDGSILFAMAEMEVVDPEGRALPRFLLLRGPAVIVVTLVENSDTGERKFLMLRQRRIGHGGESLEFPAGMMDNQVDDPVGVGVREVEEETGLKVTREDLFPLADRPLYSSHGLDDEAIHYYGCEVRLPAAEYHALEGGQRGKAEEGEFIRISLWEREAAEKAADSLQVKLGFRLWGERKAG